MKGIGQICSKSQLRPFIPEVIATCMQHFPKDVSWIIDEYVRVPNCGFMTFLQTKRWSTGCDIVTQSTSFGDDLADEILWNHQTAWNKIRAKWNTAKEHFHFTEDNPITAFFNFLVAQKKQLETIFVRVEDIKVLSQPMVAGVFCHQIHKDFFPFLLMLIRRYPNIASSKSGFFIDWLYKAWIDIMEGTTSLRDQNGLVIKALVSFGFPVGSKYMDDYYWYIKVCNQVKEGLLSYFSDTKGEHQPLLS